MKGSSRPYFRLVPFLVLALGVTLVTNTVEHDRIEGFSISLGLWVIVVGVMLWVERTDTPAKRDGATWASGRVRRKDDSL